MAGVLHSEFWDAMDEVFGRTYAKSLASDLVISQLGGRTVEQALADGATPREAWDALSEAMELTEDQRWRYRDEKPRKRRPVNRGY
jgi:hypothetical protein